MLVCNIPNLMQILSVLKAIDSCEASSFFIILEYLLLKVDYMHGLYCISYFTLCISPGRVPRLHLQIYGAVNKCVCAFSCESYCILDNVHPVARVLIMLVSQKCAHSELFTGSVFFPAVLININLSLLQAKITLILE